MLSQPMHRVIRQHIQVAFEYPVLFGRDLFSAANPAFADVMAAALSTHPHPRAAIFIEGKVARAHEGLSSRVQDYLHRRVPSLKVAGLHVVAGGETVKSVAVSDGFRQTMSEAGLDRHSFVLVMGGGALLDAVGYAASLVHRGVRVIRVPTTVLSQCDGGVGVKTAINTRHGKNFLGTFAPPFAVINDFDFLGTLADDEWRAGIAEAFKVAMIKDAGFFTWLCDHAVALGARNEEAMEQLVYRCAELHLRHIREGGDPFEMGAARPLDYGHWSAHQIERMTGHATGHGAAVATGIALDALYAVKSNLLADDAAQQLIRGLETVGFDLWNDALQSTGELLTGLDRFREHLGGRLCITLPCGAGKSVDVDQVDRTLMQSCIQDLLARSRPASCT